eukprot:gene9727-12485_t
MHYVLRAIWSYTLSQSRSTSPFVHIDPFNLPRSRLSELSLETDKTQSNKRSESKRMSGAKRMVNRRKGNFKELNNIRDIDFGVSSKDILQLAREQLIADDQSIWKGSDLLYLIPIVKNNKSKAINSFQENTVVVAKISDRYLAILRKPGDNQGAFLLKVIRKENDIVVKASFPISELRSIDYGSDEMELILSLEAQDT